MHRYRCGAIIYYNCVLKLRVCKFVNIKTSYWNRPSCLPSTVMYTTIKSKLFVCQTHICVLSNASLRNDRLGLPVFNRSFQYHTMVNEGVALKWFCQYWPPSQVTNCTFYGHNTRTSGSATLGNIWFPLGLSIERKWKPCRGNITHSWSGISLDQCVFHRCHTLGIFLLKYAICNHHVISRLKENILYGYYGDYKTIWLKNYSYP